MPTNPYTSLSVERTRYAKLRREYETIVDTDLTFTEWYMMVTEAAVRRLKLQKKLFPTLKVIKTIDNGVIIDDSKSNDVIKVWFDGKTIQCSSKTNAENYILFACLGTEFSPTI